MARTVTGLVTTVVPHSVWQRMPVPGDVPDAVDRHHRLGRRLAVPHLPQGRPPHRPWRTWCASGWTAASTDWRRRSEPPTPATWTT
ncbi:hypothetical protein [Blastococcus brunescens]|uniref:Uncharacterized protein n=1 Tax=Blastococcus brunescens TaxID=1564165 RepID=A0ABZ1ATL0_9ACTN|nr:hypothetical protein [Blastococcus sp. BMG 8361]WRL61920.1 hypothetical protein U6N30_17645 [Blastococcus sp. BMG 8361]